MADAAESDSIPDCPDSFAGLHMPADEHGRCADCGTQIVDPNGPRRAPSPPPAPWETA
jgi:hypothetical protein